VSLPVLDPLHYLGGNELSNCSLCCMIAQVSYNILLIHDHRYEYISFESIFV